MKRIYVLLTFVLICPPTLNNPKKPPALFPIKNIPPYFAAGKGGAIR